MIIIFPPTIDWNWMTQRPQQLMKQFALDGHNVYFCNRTQKKGEVITTISQNLHLVNDNRTFIRRFVPQLKKIDKIIVWVTWPRLHSFLYQYLPHAIIYDFVDDFPDWDKDVRSMVPKSKVIFVTSRILESHLKRYFPNKKSFLVPNGSDIGHFQQFKGIPPEKPVEYKDHQGPIIGYVGAWAPWIDEDLLIRISRALPQAKISLIGAEFRAKYKGSIDNIQYLGHRPYESLPQYLYHCDVCIIPFKINRVTQAANPIKMYEYLAAGKSVVSTDFPDVRNVPNVFIGKDHDQFIEFINKILSGNIVVDKKSVDEWLAHHTWEKRYQAIKNILYEELTQ